MNSYTRLGALLMEIFALLEPFGCRFYWSVAGAAWEPTCATVAFVDGEVIQATFVHFDFFFFFFYFMDISPMWNLKSRRDLVLYEPNYYSKLQFAIITL